MLMNYKTLLGSIFLAAATPGSAAHADTAKFEEFGADASGRWEYIADGVMGGVSVGSAEILNEGDINFIRLTGAVSTKNNGGFIQIRQTLPGALPAGTAGVALDMRGNGESYYVFLRTKEMTRPWHFYNAVFETGADWSTVHIPFADFDRSHDFLADTIDPQSVISIGLVAYGRDHVADLSVASLALY